MKPSLDITWDLEREPVEIKTNSSWSNDSDEYMSLFFRTAENLDAGAVAVSSRSVYLLGWCRGWTNFPTTLPSATEKIWRITR